MKERKDVDLNEVISLPNAFKALKESDKVWNNILSVREGCQSLSPALGILHHCDSSQYHPPTPLQFTANLFSGVDSAVLMLAPGPGLGAGP